MARQHDTELGEGGEFRIKKKGLVNAILSYLKKVEEIAREGSE